ncbi:MAG: hypothetical protein JXR25_02030 [Pontiellaceae bacterium]|nr:hypothetical protein [Pontiellaceae bacterium]MBN2783578.1 hypothetical protein [Pontiellaceae bacterium]
MKKGMVIAGIILLVLAPLIVITATAYTLMLPNIYAAQARIAVIEPDVEVNPFAEAKDHSGYVYNPYFLRIQFEIIQSNLVLSEVINRLNLQEEWGFNGDKIPREIALKILRNSLQLTQQRDTSIITITVRRPDPDEAARIANEIAAAYRDHQMSALDRERKNMLKAMEDSLNKQTQRVLDAEAAIQNVRQQHYISNGGAEVTPNDSPEYRLALADLENERFIYNQLNTRLRQEIIALDVPQNPVEIIDTAEPNRRPVSPNLFMNVLLSMILGAPLGLAGIIVLVVGLSKKKA